MARRKDDQGNFGITAALVVSVVVHLLLIALGWLFPFQAQSQEPVYEETTLHFDLTPMEDVTQQSTVEPRGQVPIPVPPTPAQQPPPDMQQALDQMAVPPSPAQLPPPVEEILEEEAEEATDAEDSEAGLDLPGDGTLAEGVRDDAEHARTASPQERRFNMDDALADFGHVLQQPRPEPEDSQRGVSIPDLPPAANDRLRLRQPRVREPRLRLDRLRPADLHGDLGSVAQPAVRDHRRVRALGPEGPELDSAARQSHHLHHPEERRGHRRRLETPSGCYPLDDSALDALREVILPPLPRDFPRGQETIHARFIAEGDVRSMRSNLAYLKRMGAF